MSSALIVAGALTLAAVAVLATTTTCDEDWSAVDLLPTAAAIIVLTAIVYRAISPDVFARILVAPTLAICAAVAVWAAAAVAVYDRC